MENNQSLGGDVSQGTSDDLEVNLNTYDIPDYPYQDKAPLEIGRAHV